MISSGARIWLFGWHWDDTPIMSEILDRRDMIPFPSFSSSSMKHWPSVMVEHGKHTLDM